MEYRDGTRLGVTAARPHGRDGVARDRRWSADLHHSARCGCALLGMLLLVDGSAGTLTWWRGVLWAALALLLFLALLPARVSAGDGWLASRRLLRTREVRTDLLVAARPLEGVARRLVLRDALGARVEIDPEVLLRNPGLWYHVAEGIRVSEASGTLRCGTTALHRLAERIDRETALAVFRASDLE